MHTNPIRVLGLSGSLRRASFNTALLRAAGELMPPGAVLEIHPLHGLPLFDEDVEASGDPAPVAALKTRIAAADALLIATPEYNYSIPAPLKNALDWASRPYDASVLDGKPAALMGVGATTGSARAQLHLRDVALATHMLVMGRPEVYVTQPERKFDAELRMVDQPTRRHVARMLEALIAWIKQVHPRATAYPEAA